MQPILKSMRSLKAAMTLGSRWRTTYYPAFGEFKPTRTIERAVQHVQSNAVQFEPENEQSQGSWLYFEKAANFRFPSPDKAQLLLGNRVVATYEYLGESQHDSSSIKQCA
ncbi:hypothetical protein [Shewanella gaetbuli]|uniref:Uncharacterized protein n=1 Tax=Shewanella gaetbuli TaxID=220752 RepID=A0A9X2CLQ5_9GAMM|nr:hypothetical protein [Shewanella gaetbuli]MCL1142954.1 hypothetical protein [Shewanella gaetbuli]